MPPNYSPDQAFRARGPLWPTCAGWRPRCLGRSRAGMRRSKRTPALQNHLPPSRARLFLRHWSCSLSAARFHPTLDYSTRPVSPTSVTCIALPGTSSQTQASSVASPGPSTRLNSPRTHTAQDLEAQYHLPLGTRSHVTPTLGSLRCRPGFNAWAVAGLFFKRDKEGQRRCVRPQSPRRRSCHCALPPDSAIP